MIDMKAQINKVNRSKGYTFDEWRLIADNMFEKVLNDIWKNISRKGVISTKTRYDPYTPLADERADISQTLEMMFVHFYNRFMEGDDKFAFPPEAGAFYSFSYYRCYDLFVHCNAKEGRVYSRPHDIICYDKNNALYEFHEEREARFLAAKECNMCKELENYVGMAMDDELGPEFSLWWMGYNYSEISTFMTVAGGKGTAKASIQRKMTRAFKTLGEKYSIKKGTIKNLRKFCLELEVLRQKGGSL